MNEMVSEREDEYLDQRSRHVSLVDIRSMALDMVLARESFPADEAHEGPGLGTKIRLRFLGLQLRLFRCRRRRA